MQRGLVAEAANTPVKGLVGCSPNPPAVPAMCRVRYLTMPATRHAAPDGRLPQDLRRHRLRTRSAFLQSLTSRSGNEHCRALVRRTRAVAPSVIVESSRETASNLGR